MNNEFTVLPALQPQELCLHIFKEKYAAPGETEVIDVQKRVAKALATSQEMETKFLQTQADGFIPGGRINSAAGMDRVATMINCFVQPLSDTMTGYKDGVPGIMEALGHATETMRRGGGVGYDFSSIRPMGARVKGTDSNASGPVSFMRVFDRACTTVESAGARRGAQMGVLRCDHPDIELFIDAKKAPDFKTLGLDEKEEATFLGLMQSKMGFGWAVRSALAPLSQFNISVGVSDAFMEAVVSDGDFALVHEAEPATVPHEVVVGKDGVSRFVYRTVKARYLWEKIMRNTYESADPGILFLDTINRANNLRAIEKLEATNPCGEQVLPPYGCCCLGSTFLARFVVNPFTKEAYFDYAAFRRVVAGGVRLLDRVLDVTKWPLPQQKAEAEAKRRLGIGFLGLANAMAMLGLRYGSEESAEFASTVSREQRDAAYMASVDLAKELGSFPLFNADQYLEEGTFASTLPDHIKAAIREHGIRNSHLLSIAPTGTIALAFADNASSGIEPTFDLSAYRNVRTGKGEERKLWQADDHAYRVLKMVQGEDADASIIATAQTLTVEEHLRVMAAVIPFVDSAISKTVNVPADYPFEAFANIYMDAWKSKLKGITTYRPNAITGSVLVSAADKKASEGAQDIRVDDPDRRVEIKDVPNIVETLKWPSRPDVNAEGITYSLRHPQGDFAVVVNHWENGVRHPLEVYIAGNEAPRGLGAIAKALSVDMRTDDGAFLEMKLDSLINTIGDDGFEMNDPATGKRVMMPSLTAGFAVLVKHRLTQIGAFGGGKPSPMVDALFSRREPKTGPNGAIGWHVDVSNPATGDDFLLHTKELKLPNGQVRPYSVWLSGRYPKVLDGLMKVLSIDMRVSDPKWVAMKLQKLANFGEVRGDFLAHVPGDVKQQNYPSTVAYVATLLLARMKVLGLLEGEPMARSGDAHAVVEVVETTNPLVQGGGKQCPDCHQMTVHKKAGCEVCSHCGHIGSCG